MEALEGILAVEQRAGVLVGASEIGKQGGESERAQEGGRHMPGDDALLDEPESADQVAECNPLPALAADVAEGGVAAKYAGYRGVRFGRVQGSAQGVERRRHDDGVEVARAEDGLEFGGSVGEARRRPLRHELRVGDDQGAESDHGWIERVLAEAAVEMLGNDNGNQHAQYGQPPGRDRRQGEGDQPRGDQSAAIEKEHPQRLLADRQHRRLGDERSYGRDGDLHQHGDAEYPDVNGDAW